MRPLLAPIIVIAFLFAGAPALAEGVLCDPESERWRTAKIKSLYADRSDVLAKARRTPSAAGSNANWLWSKSTAIFEDIRLLQHEEAICLAIRHHKEHMQFLRQTR